MKGYWKILLIQMLAVGFASCDDDQGEVDVEVIRDYTKPDANGDGALIGMMAERVR